MKIIKINNKEYVIKFTSQVIKELSSKKITLNSLINDLQDLKVDGLYDTFFYGLKTMQHGITEEQALSVIDEYYNEDESHDLEKFFELIIEEYSSAMGLGKMFKEEMKKQQATEEKGKIIE